MLIKATHKLKWQPDVDNSVKTSINKAVKLPKAMVTPSNILNCSLRVFLIETQLASKIYKLKVEEGQM